MKKAAGGHRISAAKRVRAPRTIDEYLARVPEPARSTLSKVRAAISSAAPRQAKEVISYRVPAFDYKGVLVWFAAFSDHWSLFPKASVIREFKEELAGYPTSRGTIRFPINKPPPIGLIKRIVKARVAQNEGNGKR